MANVIMQSMGNYSPIVIGNSLENSLFAKPGLDHMISLNPLSKQTQWFKQNCQFNPDDSNSGVTIGEQDKDLEEKLEKEINFKGITFPDSTENKKVEYFKLGNCGFYYLDENAEFNDTEKPNALITLTTDNRLFLKTKAATSFFEKIFTNYDAVIALVSNQEEVFSAIESIPNIETWIPTAHGEQMYQILEKPKILDSICEQASELKICKGYFELYDYLYKFNNCWVYDSTTNIRINKESKKIEKVNFNLYNEFNKKLTSAGLQISYLEFNKIIKELDNCYLDILDTPELKNSINKLNKNASIFLFACKNGKGKEDKLNLANTMNEYAGTRKIISAYRAITGRNYDCLEIKSIYPLDLEIKGIGDDFSGNITYIPEKN